MHERNMREGLREVADQLSMLGVVFLAEQADVRTTAFWSEWASRCTYHGHRREAVMPPVPVASTS